MSRLVSAWKPKTSDFTKKSEGIFNLFTKTQNDCLTLNAEIASHKASKEQEIQNLQEEVKVLESLTTKHNNLHKKIDEFLNS